MNHEAARVADIGEMADQFDAVDEFDAGVIAAANSEGEDGARAFRTIGAVQIV